MLFPNLRILVLLNAALAFFLSGIPGPAQAHSLNESYVYFNVTDDELSGRIEVNTRDLARVFAPDAADVAPWTREEVEARLDEVFDYFDGRLQLRDGAASYAPNFTGLTFLGKQAIDGSDFAQLQFDVPELLETPQSIELTYSFLFSDIDPTHRGFALIESNTRTGVVANESYISLVFGPGDGLKTLRLDGEPALELFIDFVMHGIWHIWLGFEHLLFLLTLLLASVMALSASRTWEPAPDLGALGKPVVLVTIFTLVHTVALGLATFGIFTLPVTLVEAVIAVSIALLALGNVIGRAQISPALIAAVFGLVHGLGYAYVLSPLGLEPVRKGIGLIAFNVGMEIGQIVVILLVFPILFVLRKLFFYRPLFLQFGSVCLILFTAVWFVERTFDVLGPVRQMVFG